MSTAYPTPDNNQPANPYTQPAQPAPEPAKEPKKKGGCMKWGGIGAGILILIALAGSCGGGDSDGGKTEMSSAVTSAEVEPSSAADSPAAESEASPAPAPAEDTPAPAEEKKSDDVPREYKSALRSAETYTKMSGFSYNGLYEQLTSEYGEGYPPEAAQYALDNLDVDWNEQALKAAKNYQNVMPMSDDGLFEQLTSEYGEGFTAEQAQYAIDHLDD